MEYQISPLKQLFQNIQHRKHIPECSILAYQNAIKLMPGLELACNAPENKQNKYQEKNTNQ